MALSTDHLEQAVAELAKLGNLLSAQAALEVLESQRKKDKWVLYWQPLESQIPSLRAFTADKKIFVIRGGNRSGKTEEGSFITTAFALGKEYFKGEPAWEWVKDLPIPEGRPRNIWIVGLDFNVLRDVIWREKLIGGKEHGAFIPKDAVITNIRHDDKQIFFSDGTVITCKSADSGREKFQSASVDLIWIDEECDASIFDECYQRTVDCGGKILVTVTPLVDPTSGIKEPWIFDLYEEMQAGRSDIGFFSLSVLDNPKVPQLEKDLLIKKWAGHVEERARLYGEFVRRAGMVYPMWDRKKHLVPPFRPDSSWMRVVSIDPAATGITAAIWAAVAPNGDITIYKEYYQSDLVVSDHAKNIKIRNAGDTVDVWLIDPKWGTQRNGETHKTGMQLYRDNGLPVRLAEVNEDWGRTASLEYMQATVDPTSRHPKVFITNNLTNFISEVEHYTWDIFQKGILKGLSKEKPIKRNDHLMNAYQYLCAMKPRPRQRLESVYSDEEKRRLAQQNSSF